MSLTFKQLDAFLTAARLGSFTAAAQKLHTTQSAVSKRIGELERVLGTKLLHRTPKGLQITPPGRQLFAWAEQAHHLRLQIERAVNDGAVLRGLVRIGTTELVAMTWLTRLVQRLRAEHPELILEPLVDAGMPLLQRVESHAIDLAILPGRSWGPTFDTVPVGQVQDVWMASPSLDLPRRALRPEEFAELPILEQSTGSAKNRYYEAWFAEHGFRFRRVFATNSVAVLRELTINGFGVSQLALEYARPDIEAGRLRIVRSVPMPPAMVYGAVSRKDNLSPAIAHIVNRAIEVCDFSIRTDVERNAPPAGARKGSAARRGP